MGRRVGRREFGLVGCLLALVGVGCETIHKQAWRRSENENHTLRVNLSELQQERDQLLAQQEQARRSVQQLQQQMAGYQQAQSILDQRLANYRLELERLQAEYTTVVMTAAGHDLQLLPAVATVHAPVPPDQLPASFIEQLTALAHRHADFQFLNDSQNCHVRWQSGSLFEPQSAQLRAASRPMLDDLARLLQQPGTQTLHLQLAGHVAPSATSNDPQADWLLAAQQAIAVASYLQQAGVAGTRIGVVSYGSQQPFDIHQDERAQHHNARIEIFFMPEFE